MRLPKTWLGATLVALIVGSASFAPSGGAAKPFRRAAPGARSVTPLGGVCDSSTALDVLGDLGERESGRKRNQIAVLQGRILDCSRKIDAALMHLPSPSPTPYWVATRPAPAATPTPTPECTKAAPATMASNRFALYEQLERCVVYWTYLSASPTPEPTATPLPSVASAPTFYVFATGAADTDAATVFIRSMVEHLTNAQRKAASGLTVAGRADWTTPEEFASQCQLDPNTRGALVVETSIPETYRRNYLLLVANFTNVSASVEMLGCGDEDHSPAVSPLRLGSPQAITGKAHQDALPLGLFTSLVPFLIRDTSTTTVTVGRGTTKVTKTDSTAPVLSGALLGFFETQNLTFPAQNGSVALDIAADRFADAALARLHALCGDAQIARLAAQANPHAASPPPLERRTPVYKAAYEYVRDCSSFANFNAAAATLK